MKTILERIKYIFENDSNLQSYIRKVEVVSPRLLPEIPVTKVPYIGIAPVRTNETWYAQKKQASHVVELYVVTYIINSEIAILGDTNKQGLLEVVTDVETAIRGHRLDENGDDNFYLAKPIEISGIEYITTPYGDDAYLFVSSLTLQCVRLFDITLP